MSWQKKTQSETEVQAGKVIEKPNDYGIDAEIGRLEVPTFEIKRGSQKVFSTGRDVFPETGSREHYKTVRFRELALFFPCDEPFRKSAQKLNRVLRRKEGQEVRARTMANLVEREGEQIQAYVGKKAERILEDHGFTTDGSLTDQEKARSSIEGSDVTLDHKVLSHVIEELNRGQEKEKQIELSELNETFEDPNAVKANISIDDVCCKKQKVSGRKKGSLPKEKREMVYNTVAHIQNKDSKTYTLNTSTISQMMTEVLAWLWLGKVERAINVLSDLKEDTIKSTTERDNLIKYLHRNQACIPCYALRKKLGLRISSNPVEKANDLLVSNRQKHNGMSWSADGSTSLATLTSVRRNGEHMHWLLHHDIRFPFPQPAANPAA